MQLPKPTWETEYKHDRRLHRHRCVHCRKILNEGDRVIMSRVVGRKTKAVHLDCATETHIGVWTVRDAMEAWGTEFLRSCGWKIPEHPMSKVPT